MRRAIVAASAALTLAAGQPPAVPTDFSGVWNYATMTPLERPREFAERETLTVEEAQRYERQTVERQATTNNTAGPDWWDPGTRHLTSRRTSLIVDPPDGRLPPLTPDAQRRSAERVQARRQRPLAEGPEDLALNERCLQWAVAGPPMTPGVYNNNVEFIQTRDAVVIFNEMIHDARIVPLDGRAHGTMRRWMGDSRGHWDGHTLVVDTINFSEKVSFRGADEHVRLVERFTRIDADTIDYQFTVEDPSVWTSAWTARFPMHRANDRIYEYACHEGNARSVEGILLGARAQERERR
ncbi:MAG TPA: hypothetical protein VGY48_06830 [Vicinamibacterales bacterium]|nr:hypothetical protein [Vicinamibacterales bacterium]